MILPLSVVPMKISVLKERRAYEKRVAISPDMVKKYRALGYDVVIETGAGEASSFLDDHFKAMGATIAASPGEALSGADIVLKVQRPMSVGEGEDEISLIPDGATLIGMLNPYSARQDIHTYAARNISAMSMELMPRITRAQSMDVLSSQSNLVGYRAVIDAAAEFGRAFPMMMTAAGTVAPAQVFVMGAGVAGLQAIATAKRLGGAVFATDVRPVAKEQVESLGGRFVMVENEETAAAETAGGYAKEMSDDYKRQQAELIAKTLKKQDIVICTALIPGRAAPKLVTKEMLDTMKPGSIVVDLAVEQGGNCAMSEAGKVVEYNGVKIIGYRNMPSRIPEDASALYARNVLNFVTLMSAGQNGDLTPDWDDEIVRSVTLTRDNAIQNEQFRQFMPDINKENEMTTNEETKGTMQAQLVSQWITSLAISVVCCSVLFIVFAGYIVQLHETTNLLTVRVEMIRDRQNYVEDDLAVMRRTPVVTLTTAPAKSMVQIQPAKATSENGMELSGTATGEGTKETVKAEDLMLSATGEISLPNDALNPDVATILDEKPLSAKK